MTTPNAMPRNNNQIKQAVLSGLIATKPATWKKKVWNDETKSVDEVKVSHEALRFPLAQNVSELNVERAARGS